MHYRLQADVQVRIGGRRGLNAIPIAIDDVAVDATVVDATDVVVSVVVGVTVLPLLLLFLVMMVQLLRRWGFCFDFQN